MKITPISGIPSNSRTYRRDRHKLFEVIDDFRLSNAEFAEIIFDDTDYANVLSCYKSFNIAVNKYCEFHSIKVIKRGERIFIKKESNTNGL